jgi:hypothetical protein
MARWPDGPMARWPDGPMARWHDGTMARWHDGLRTFVDMYAGNHENEANFVPTNFFACSKLFHTGLSLTHRSSMMKDPNRGLVR